PGFHLAVILEQIVGLHHGHRELTGDELPGVLVPQQPVLPPGRIRSLAGAPGRRRRRAPARSQVFHHRREHPSSPTPPHRPLPRKGHFYLLLLSFLREICNCIPKNTHVKDQEQNPHDQREKDQQNHHTLLALGHEEGEEAKKKELAFSRIASSAPQIPVRSHNQKKEAFDLETYRSQARRRQQRLGFWW
uniref:Uncharacterized protein n=1 Tax=Oryza brachyantha TaxID=4533 RepID=J3N4K9_ORYBR